MLRCTLVQTGTVRVGGCEIDAIDRCDRSPHARVQAEAQGACCARLQVLARSRRRAFLRGGEHFVVLFLPLAGPLLFAILFVGWPFAFCLCAVSSASPFIRVLYCIVGHDDAQLHVGSLGSTKIVNPRSALWLWPSWFTAVPSHAWHALARWTCRPVRLCVPLGRRSECARISH